MKRKIYERLLEWKERDKGSCALLLDGARRVGKSYIAEQFGRNEYKSCLMIDFAHLPQEVRTVFENDISDLDLFFNKLSAYYCIEGRPSSSLTRCRGIHRQGS